MALNVNGSLELKLGMNDFVDFLNMYDVVCLSETWANESNDLDIVGFRKPFCKFRKRKRFGRRDSGGLCVYFRKNLVAGVEEINWDYEDGLLFKLKGLFFGWKEDVYLFCIYMRSNQSTRENVNEGPNCYDELLDKLSRVPGNADIFVAGDFNARVSNRNECLIESSQFCIDNQRENSLDWMDNGNENAIFEADFYENNMSCKRENKDKKVNDYGIRLLNLCNAVDLCILNGRAFKDKGQGNLTFCNKNGESTIDFVLASKFALYKLCNYEILPFNIFSDHAAITFDLKVSFQRETCTANVKGGKNRVKTKWNPENKDKFISSLNNENIAKRLDNISFDCADVREGKELENYIKEFTEVLLEAGADHTKEVKLFKGNREDRKRVSDKKNGWYDNDCYKQGKIFKGYESRYWFTGTDEDRVAMCEQRNIYRKLCKEKKAKFYRSEAEMLAKLSKSEPKEFWRKIKGNSGRDELGHCNFYEHFKNLASIESRVGEEGKREVEEGENLHTARGSELLDKNIDLVELDKAIKSLKGNKSSGEDNIINEFFINASVGVKFFIIILFNKILELEYFPSQWAVGKIIPVFKKGDRNDANNYRGITIISCLAKLFTKIMNDRLTKWVDSQKILTDSQYGFRKGRSTTDCLFIIQGLIDIIFARGLKLYVCFIDYEKAYDLIDRACLFHKLIKTNISSKCINIFKDMYAKMKVTLDCDIENRYFASNVGLLQGESTSPLLFSLFVNDLEHSLPNEHLGVNAINILIKLLMFADDMAIFSTTIEGLQIGLNNLSKYCAKWGLTVNIPKTKIVIFKKSGIISSEEKWSFQGQFIEIVSSFKYLGCVLSSNGTYTECISTLVTSARRALFCLKKYINNNSETLPCIQLQLFSSKVTSILNYGSEIWGLRKADAMDVFHLSFLKSCLGVKTSTPSCFVYGELGVFPLIIERKVRVVKYWLKIIKDINNDENYMQIVYKELLRINREAPGNMTWVSQVKKLLESCGFGYIWRNQFVHNENQFLNEFKERIKDMYLQDWSSQVQLTSENRLYKNIKTNFKLEPYLNLNNRALRVSLSKIRLSSHIFNIERGRWGPVRQEVNERKCTVCRHEIENEFHCLIRCPRFNNERKGLLPNYLENEPTEYNFLKYLKSNCLKDQKKLSILCLKVMKEYREMM